MKKLKFITESEKMRNMRMDMEMLNINKIIIELNEAYQNKHQYNIKHGIVPPSVLLEEILISDLADSFAQKYGCDRDFLKESLYRYLNGTAPSCVWNNKILPYSKPHNRLHNWLWRNMEDKEKVFHNQLLPKQIISGILNGREEFTLESIYVSIAIPCRLDQDAFQYLIYEVLEDYDNEKIRRFYSLKKDGNGKSYLCNAKINRDQDRERTIFITGASGFIARHLLTELKNCRLILLYHKIPSQQDLALIPDGSILYVGDIRNEILIKRIFLENQIDIVYWMAGLTTRKQCPNPVGTYLYNCNPLHVIYQLMDEKIIQLKGIILPSTCLLKPFYHYSVKELMHVFNNEDLSKQYTISKLFMELEAVYFSSYSRFPVVITRLSQVYGNDPDSDRLIPVSIKKAKQGDDLICVIDKTGRSQQIAPIHVLDAVKALSLVCEKIMSDDYDFCSGRCLNIMGPQILTVEEILNKIAVMFQKRVGIKKKINKNLTFDRLDFLTDETWKMIGFMPEITIDKGLTTIC